jgi:hypothetical protein
MFYEFNDYKNALIDTGMSEQWIWVSTIKSGKCSFVMCPSGNRRLDARLHGHSCIDTGMSLSSTPIISNSLSSTPNHLHERSL